MVMRQMNWKSVININREQLNYIRFVDDSVLITENTIKLQKMLQDLNTKSSQVGLKINHSKTKFLWSDTLAKAQITTKGEQMEEVEQYVYLGQEINKLHNQEGELSRRKKAGWCAFNSIKDVLQGKINKATCASLFTSTVLPAMLYGSETWSLMKTEKQQLSAMERVMERRILGISICNQIPNEGIIHKSGVQDVIVESRHSKMQWAGRIARLTDNQ
ncbi:unnamed protein product [Caretta caretta]